MTKSMVRVIKFAAPTVYTLGRVLTRSHTRS